MKRKSVFSIKLLSTAIILGITAFSCTNNDTTDSSTATTTDTVAKMNADPSVVADTSKMSNNAANSTVSTPGIAKPNPAKKGLKGKVAVLETPVSKSDAKMEADNSGVYANVEILPSFPGGYKGLQKFFDDNLVYPEAASNDGVDGTVNVTFVVDETGKLTSPQVSGENLGYGLENEALRVVNKMPAWNPGKLKGKNVKTKFSLPVRFELY
jgi:protein TonB